MKYPGKWFAKKRKTSIKANNYKNNPSKLAKKQKLLLNTEVFFQDILFTEWKYE